MWEPSIVLQKAVVIRARACRKSRVKTITENVEDNILNYK